MNQYHAGDSVKVNEGITDPDFPKVVISGWQGRIIETDEEPDTGKPLVLAEWDSLTLLRMPANYMKHCIEDNIDCFTMWLYEDEVSATDPRDSEEETAAQQDQMEEQYGFNEDVKRKERIDKLLSEAENPNDETECHKVWWVHMRANLDFPFQAIANEDGHNGKVRQGDVIKVSALAGIDQQNGMLLKARTKFDQIKMAMIDIEALEKAGINHELIEDYNFWFNSLTE